MKIFTDNAQLLLHTSRKVPILAPGLIRKTLLPALLFAFLFLLASCGDQSTFEVKGEVAQRQLELFWIIFALAALVFVVVEGALIYSAFRYRRRPGQAIPKQTHGHTKLEIAWTIAPTIILIGVAIPTLLVIFNTSSSSDYDVTLNVVDEVVDPSNEVTVEQARFVIPTASVGDEITVPRMHITARAHQWWWEFRYSDDEIETANELHIPINTRVDVDLFSDDVIHSFWIPNLAGKLDVVPTVINKTWFMASEAGIYEGRCAEFCGLAHADMKFVVVAHEWDDYDSWKLAYNALPQPPTGDALLGQAVFLSKGCVLCHNKDAVTTLEVREQQRNQFMEGNNVVPGPNLKHFATRTTMASGIAPLTQSNLESWLSNPEEFKPGNRMAELAAVYNDPTQAMTDEEVKQLTAYLLTLRPAAEAIPTPTPDPASVPPTATPDPFAPTATPAPSPTPVVLPPGDAARGAEVFQTSTPLTCVTCHSLDGTVGLGPTQQGIANTAGNRIPGMDAREYITQSLLDTNSYIVEGFPADLMPANFIETIGPQAVADVIEYLLTLN